MRRGRSLAVLALAGLLACDGCSGGEDRSGGGARAARVGGTIAFDDDSHDVWTVASDGSRLHRLTSAAAPEFDPSFAPDGSRIAYRSEVDGNSEIYVMDADGGHAHDVSRNPASDYSPSWSPAGTRIAFASDRGGGRNDVYVMAPDGSHVTRLTNDPAVDEYPTWSPDGRQLAFVSDRDGSWAIYATGSDGSDEHRLTETAGKLPSWSPKGDWIAFQGPGTQGDDEHSTSIWLVRPDGSDEHRLGTGYTPAWAPTGDALVAGTGRGLAVIGLDGRIQRYVAPSPALDPSWAAAGR